MLSLHVYPTLRKNCNHPDLITGGLDGSLMYPSAEEMVSQCGKMRLMQRLLEKLRAVKAVQVDSPIRLMTLG